MPLTPKNLTFTLIIMYFNLVNANVSPPNDLHPVAVSLMVKHDLF